MKNKIPERIIQVYDLVKEMPDLILFSQKNNLIIEFWKKYDGYFYDVYDPSKCTNHDEISAAAKTIYLIGAFNKDGKIKSKSNFEKDYINYFIK